MNINEPLPADFGLVLDPSVLRPRPEVLAVNTLADNHSDASIALADKDLFIRTRQNVYCISQK